MTSEDMAFGPEFLLLRVCGKIFACVSLEGKDYFTLKCDPEYALELREHYPEIQGAWHWNKKYWNQVKMRSSLPKDFVHSLIRHSYAEVVKKLPRRQKLDTPQIMEILK